MKQALYTTAPVRVAREARLRDAITHGRTWRGGARDDMAMSLRDRGWGGA